jgi:hypothetical protein
VTSPKTPPKDPWAFVPPQWSGIRRALNKVQDVVTDHRMVDAATYGQKALDIAVKLGQAKLSLTSPLGIATTALSALHSIQEHLENKDHEVEESPLRVYRRNLEGAQSIAPGEETPVAYVRMGYTISDFLESLDIFHTMDKKVYLTDPEGGEQVLHIYMEGDDKPTFILFTMKPAAYSYSSAKGSIQDTTTTVKRTGKETIEFAYHRKDFDWVRLRDRVWSILGDQVLKMQATQTAGGSSRTVVRSVPVDANEYLGKNSIDEFHTQSELYKSRGISRALKLYGPPGSGKTSFLRIYARKYKKTMLHIPPSYLCSEAKGDIELFCDLCRPEVLLFDDIHEAQQSISFAMNLLDDLRRKYPDMLVVATYNPIPEGQMPAFSALLRPGRTGARREFLAPDKAEKKDLLAYYMKYYKVDPALFDLDPLVAEMKDAYFTHDYVRAVAEEAVVLDQKDLLAYTKDLNSVVRSMQLSDEETTKRRGR